MFQEQRSKIFTALHWDYLLMSSLHILAFVIQGCHWTRWKVQLLCRRRSELVRHSSALLPTWEWEEMYPCSCKNLLPRVWSSYRGVLWSAHSEEQRRNLQPGWAAGGSICYLHHLEQRQPQRFRKDYFVLCNIITWKMYRFIHYNVYYLSLQVIFTFKFTFLVCLFLNVFSFNVSTLYLSVNY